MSIFEVLMLACFGAAWPFSLVRSYKAVSYTHLDVYKRQANSYGTPIYAAADGTVTESDDSGWGGGYGYHITIRHNGTYSTRYAHMSKLSVRVGASVSKGQLIGYMGSTGDSTGNHLHFEVIKNGSRVDPVPYLP